MREERAIADSAGGGGGGAWKEENENNLSTTAELRTYARWEAREEFQIVSTGTDIRDIK